MAARSRSRRQRRRFRPVRAITTRLSESVGTVRQAVAEPRAVPLRLRDGLLRLWRTRGGGFYGFGYVVAFVVLEVHAFITNWIGTDDVVGMVVQEVLGFLFRFAGQSLLNGVLAFGWPVFVLQYLGGWGLTLLGVAWWLFDRFARPVIVARLPEPAPKPARTPPNGELRSEAQEPSEEHSSRPEKP